MPLSNRDFDPQARLRQRQAGQAGLPTATPAPGAPLQRVTAGTPMPAAKPALTQQQINRRARNNGVPPPAGAPSSPSAPRNPATPTAQPNAGSGGAVRRGDRPPNPSSDALPADWARAVKSGKMTEAKARQMWANRLKVRGKVGPGIPGAPAATPPPAAGGPAPPAAPGAAPPAPGTPIGPPLGGSPGGPISPPGFPASGGGGAPWVLPGDPLQQPGQGGTDFRDPMMQFLSMVPGMRANTQHQIAGAMANAGFGGNRYGTSAMNTAGQIGAEAGMAENAMMQNLLADYADKQENRALGATGQAMQLGDMLDRQAQDRARLPFEMGQWENQRQDDFAKLRYADFENNKTGWLPMLSQLAMSQGAGSPGQIYQTSEPGKAGGADYLTLLAQFL